MKKIILIGDGGHANSLIDVIESSSDYRIIGFISQVKNVGVKICGYPVVGNDADLPSLVNSNINFVIAVGQIKSNVVRKRLFNYLKVELEANLPAIKASTSYVSRHAELESGVVVFHQAVVNARSKIGQNSIINTLALVEHDVVIGNHVHIATGAVVNGDVLIGDGTFIGSGAVIRQGITIGENCFIQAGSVVLDDVPSGTAVNAWRSSN
jgi:sugar O-acyltransferase (sialic acid O-acetyltransferase NeuD family)